MRQGNSLIIGIPAEMAERLAIREGDDLTFSDDGGALVYRKVRPT